MLGFFSGLGACAKPQKVAPFATEAPARVVVVRTERFALRASMYVDLYATIARGAATEADDPTPRLLRCEDDACAGAAVASSVHARAFAAALPAFGDRWRADFIVARAAIERALPWLLAHEDELVVRLTGDLGLRWPSEPVVLAVTAHAASRGSRASVDAPTLDVEEGCFAGPAILECALTQALRTLEAGPPPPTPRRTLVHAVGRAVSGVVPGYVPEEARANFLP